MAWLVVTLGNNFYALVTTYGAELRMCVCGLGVCVREYCCLSQSLKTEIFTPVVSPIISWNAVLVLGNCTCDKMAIINLIWCLGVKVRGHILVCSFGQWYHISCVLLLVALRIQPLIAGCTEVVSVPITNGNVDQQSTAHPRVGSHYSHHCNVTLTCGINLQQ